jgi:hypothetical protein
VFVLPAPQSCTTPYDGCGGASMLSVIREGLEEAKILFDPSVYTFLCHSPKR